MSLETILVALRRSAQQASCHFLHVGDSYLRVFPLLALRSREMAEPSNRKIPQPAEGSEFPPQ